MFEYRVIPAPLRPQKAKKIKGTAALFSNTLQNTINAQAKEGWEFIRSETLPCEEKTGLRARETVFQTVLVFRKAAQVSEPASEPEKAAQSDLAELHAPEEPKALIPPPARPTAPEKADPPHAAPPDGEAAQAGAEPDKATEEKPASAPKDTPVKPAPIFPGVIEGEVLDDDELSPFSDDDYAQVEALEGKNVTPGTVGAALRAVKSGKSHK